MSWLSSWNNPTLRLCIVVALFVMTMVGCSQNPYATAHVTGTVLCDGKPATGGIVTLRPIDAPEVTGRPKNRPGQPATGIVAADGTFSLTLVSVGNDVGRKGALVGPHEVVFKLPRSEPWSIDPSDESLPAADVEKIKAELAKRPVFPALSCGRAIWPDTVDVKKGRNDLKFVLLPESFVPKVPEKRRGHGTNEDHIKIDPALIEPSTLNTVKK